MKSKRNSKLKLSKHPKGMRDFGRNRHFTKSWLKSVKLDSLCLLASCCAPSSTYANADTQSPLTNAGKGAQMPGGFWINVGVWSSYGGPVADNEDSSCGQCNYLAVDYAIYISDTPSPTLPTDFSDWDYHGNCTFKFVHNSSGIHFCLVSGSTRAGSPAAYEYVDCEVAPDLTNNKALVHITGNYHISGNWYQATTYTAYP